ncbi:MAG TPA: SigB/SigF/SigG family RNA polymerase sigma factor [Solirubrobacteraceae bacterium]|nr:SigB/SigF/SigG family RNA polymerase sigma factor [Solirubrobacteraceae bacterium]
MASVATAPQRNPSLEARGERALFGAWRGGDSRARDALVHRFMPLARALARRYDHASEPFDDLLQVAHVGLLKALDRFDPELGFPFQSFAIPTILGEVRRYFRDAGWSVHVSRSSQERALKLRTAQTQLAGRWGRAPTVNELAEYLELDTEEVVEVLQVVQAYEAASLDAPQPGGAEDPLQYADAIGRVDERYELIELDATLVAVLGQIPARERSILRMRFVEDLTQTEIAARVGVSQMQVSRLLRQTVARLRALAEAPAGA